MAGPSSGWLSAVIGNILLRRVYWIRLRAPIVSVQQGRVRYESFPSEHSYGIGMR